jgi:circadian clock protein KaiC
VAMEESDVQRSRPVDTPTLSSICDTLVQLSVRTEGSMRRYLALRKSRVSRCDLQVREMVLTPTGVDLAEPEGTLAG